MSLGLHMPARRVVAYLACLTACALCAGCDSGASAADASAAVVVGSVTDPAGAPLVGVRVSVNRCSGARPVEFGAFHAVTDAQGGYRIPVRWADGAQLTLAEIRFALPGYVSASWQVGHALSPGEEFRVDFRLQAGEILAGKIECPLTAMERQAGLDAQDKRFQFRVSNDGFDEYFLTDRGGSFEIYVPPGTYTIRGLDPPLVLSDVATGARDLLLRPEPVEITPERLSAAFEALWSEMDRSYSQFELKRVDWKALRGDFEPRIAKCTTLGEFVELLTVMLGRLEDQHVWIDTPDGVVGTHRQPYQRNWSPDAVRNALAETDACGDFALVACTKTGFGVLIITKQDAATHENVDQTLAALRKHRDAPGFVVDLRGGCSGGNELLARRIASSFCDRDVVYARSQYRAGPAHEDLSEPTERVLRAGEQPFTRPVVCLIGQKCMSSGEGLVQMMSALPQVTTVGMRTRGSSGNPKPFALPGLPVQVWFSRWVDLLPDGTPIEGAGIAPDVAVNEPLSAYGERDPTWERAVELLTKKTAANAAPAAAP